MRRNSEAVTTPDPARLARIARDRRNELGLTQRQAADAAGVSDQTWLTLENGRTVSRRTLAGVDEAMQWEPGSARAVLMGGDPTPIGASISAAAAEADRLLQVIEERLGIDDEVLPEGAGHDERLEAILDAIDRNLGLGANSDGNDVEPGRNEGAANH